MKIPQALDNEAERPSGGGHNFQLKADGALFRYLSAVYPEKVASAELTTGTWHKYRDLQQLVYLSIQRAGRFSPAPLVICNEHLKRLTLKDSFSITDGTLSLIFGRDLKSDDAAR